MRDKNEKETFSAEVDNLLPHWRIPSDATTALPASLA